jgi:hypothetical protein
VLFFIHLQKEELGSTMTEYKIENAELAKVIARINQIQQNQRQIAMFFAAISFGQGLNTIKNVGRYALKAWHMDSYYQSNNVASKSIQLRRTVSVEIYNPTTEQRAAAKAYAKEKMRLKLNTKRAMAGRIASVVMSVLSFGANMAALGLTFHQLLNEKSASEEWAGLMKNHTEGIEKVKGLLTNITMQEYEKSNFEMSTESKDKLRERLNKLKEVSMFNDLILRLQES